MEKGGRPETFCYLNELQCTFVITLSRNSPEVVKFKLSLVVAFDSVEKEVALLQEVIKESADYLEKKRLYYQKEGYNEAWIEARLKNIDVREDLETIWCKRGINTPKQYAILTSIISEGTFGITPKEHSELKGSKKQPLRNHITRLELIFMTLAEESAAEFTEMRKPTKT